MKIEKINTKDNISNILNSLKILSVHKDMINNIINILSSITDEAILCACQSHLDIIQNIDNDEYLDNDLLLEKINIVEKIISGDIKTYWVNPTFDYINSLNSLSDENRIFELNKLFEYGFINVGSDVIIPFINVNGYEEVRRDYKNKKNLKEYIKSIISYIKRNMINDNSSYLSNVIETITFHNFISSNKKDINKECIGIIDKYISLIHSDNANLNITHISINTIHELSQLHHLKEWVKK